MSLSCTYSAIVFCMGMMACAQGESRQQAYFIVERNYENRTASEKTILLLDWKEVAKHLKSTNGIEVIDLNFGEQVPVQIADTNGDGKADKVVVELTFRSNEPVFSYVLKSTDSKFKLTTFSGQTDKRLQVNFLAGPRNTVQDWPTTIIESTRTFYPDPYAIARYAPERWNYEYGFFLTGVWQQYKRTGKKEYLTYVQQWVDRFVMDDGKLNPQQYKPLEYKLDDILPGRLLIFLYEETNDARYKTAADQLADQLIHQPKTSEGGYWHKEIYPSQMWLDGIYMADIFSMQYARAFNKPEFLNEAVAQIKLISKHTTDAATGLLYHGWDESKNKVWAHPQTGTSPEFWGRAIGWYMMALVECLYYIPDNHPERKTLIELLQNVSAAVARQQDKQSLLWYQVINKGNQPGNWIETSSSAMFIYAFAKGHRAGWLDKKYYDLAASAFNSLVRNYVKFDEAGRLYLDQTVKIGTLNPKGSKGDYEYYITTERRINDYKGLSPLLFASIEFNESVK
ncbi:MAG: glycoside hydrolase family 88 protein [Cyclobacteriaceae bacterium]|nr:glycoside hydrolase family 88 protein [Cyclobacteriaceae bacterium]